MNGPFRVDKQGRYSGIVSVPDGRHEDYAAAVKDLVEYLTGECSVLQKKATDYIGQGNLSQATSHMRKAEQILDVIRRAVCLPMVEFATDAEPGLIARTEAAKKDKSR